MNFKGYDQCAINRDIFITFYGSSVNVQTFKSSSIYHDDLPVNSIPKRSFGSLYRTVDYTVDVPIPV